MLPIVAGMLAVGKSWHAGRKAQEHIRLGHLEGFAVAEGPRKTEQAISEGRFGESEACASVAENSGRLGRVAKVDVGFPD
jgi:hypothetical protein